MSYYYMIEMQKTLKHKKFRKSDYPQYYGGPKRSRGPRTFRYWYHMIQEYYSMCSIKHKRWLMSQWLSLDKSSL